MATDLATGLEIGLGIRITRRGRQTVGQARPAAEAHPQLAHGHRSRVEMSTDSE
jgi:hypothetical protein